MKQKLHENDLGDRMALGLPYGTSGVVNPGAGTFSSPDVSQTPSSFYQDGPNKVSSYNNDKAVGIDKSDVDSLKGRVTPDEILCGMEYEMKRMVDRNKGKAKEIVVANLKRDPKYYSSLGMLIHGDERINESVDPEKMAAEKKKAFEEIFSGMMASQGKTTVRNVDERVVNAYKETAARSHEKRKSIFPIITL
jgi:hypothetical protein